MNCSLFDLKLPDRLSFTLISNSCEPYLFLVLEMHRVLLLFSLLLLFHHGNDWNPWFSKVSSYVLSSHSHSNLLFLPLGHTLTTYVGNYWLERWLDVIYGQPGENMECFCEQPLGLFAFTPTLGQGLQISFALTHISFRTAKLGCH